MAQSKDSSKWRCCGLVLVLVWTVLPGVACNSAGGADFTLVNRTQNEAHNSAPFILPDLHPGHGRTSAFNGTVVQRRRRRQPLLQATSLRSTTFTNAATKTTTMPTITSTTTATTDDFADELAITSTAGFPNEDEATIEMGLISPNSFLGEDAVSLTSMLWDANGTLDTNTETSTSNETCYGAPEYCNLTRAEYEEMLREFIHPKWPGMLLIGAHAVVFTMGLVGNALVCIAVYTNYTMRTVTNIFIVNLAVADFLVILFCLPPTVVWDVTMTWYFGETLCKVVLYFQTVAVTVSVLTLTFISIDRWYAICFPLRYVSTNVRAVCSIAFIWALALSSDIMEFVYATTKLEPLRFNIEMFTQCIVTWNTHIDTMFNVGRAMFLYLIPLLLMSVAYYQIVRVLWKSDTIPGHRESRSTVHTCGYVRSSGPAANSSTMGQLRARRKAAKMLVAVVVMFAICYFPVHLVNILRFAQVLQHSEISSVLSLLSHWLCYANSAVNPLIYNFMSGKFRREFRNALDKCRCVRARIEDRFGPNHPACSRTNHMSPSSRSNYHLTSLRDLNSLRDRQTSMHAASFAETVAGGGAGSGLNGHGQHLYQSGGHPLNRRLSHLQQQQPSNIAMTSVLLKQDNGSRPGSRSQLDAA